MISEQSSPEFLLVDVRRNDYEGGTIVGSLNLPAHSFYMNRASLHALCKKAGVKRVAFYCGESMITAFFRMLTRLQDPRMVEGPDVRAGLQTTFLSKAMATYSHSH